MNNHDNNMAKFAYYGITTPEGEEEAAILEEQEIQLTLFDFNQLDTETRTIAQREDREFDQNIGTGNKGYIMAGQNLARLQQLLKYKKPGFVGYLNSKRIPQNTAYKLINIGKMFTESVNISSIEALALLAAPSTPNEARQEAVGRAGNGEVITHSTAKEIVSEWRKPTRLEYEAQQQRHYTETQWELHGQSPYDSHLDAALDDQDKPACPECGQVYDGESCPDCQPKMSQPIQVLLSHESTEWYTPPEYIEAARLVLGSIDLDPATASIPQEWIKATIIYTLADNGLIRPWQGRVWLNPPYSTTDGKSNQETWSQRLIEQYEAGRVTEAILLVKASLGYNWFDRLFDTYPVCFKRGLINFINQKGESGPAKLGSAFFYLGPNLARFIEVFGKIGRVVVPE